MQVEVDKMDRTVSVVEAIHIRHRAFEPFAFRINYEDVYKRQTQLTDIQITNIFASASRIL